MGEITTIVFERLQHIQPGSPAADEAAAAGGVLPHISSVVAAAAAEAAAVKAAAAAEAAAAEAAAAEAAAAAAAASAAEQQQGGEGAPAAAGAEDAAPAAAAAQQLPAAGQDACVMQQQPSGPPNVLTLATGPIQTAGSLSDSRTPGMAAAVAAAAAAAAAGASAGGAGRPGSTVQDEEDAVSDAGATVASSTVAFAESVSGADGVAARGLAGQASLGGAVAGVPGSLAGLNVVGYQMGASTYSHGLPCAVEVLNFLIDCVAQRRLDADGSSGAAGAAGGPADDEYAMFGLSMVHRAVLAGGSMLHSHEALLSLLHKDLFAAMVVAVSGMVTGHTCAARTYTDHAAQEELVGMCIACAGQQLQLQLSQQVCLPMLRRGPAWVTAFKLSMKGGSGSQSRQTSNDRAAVLT